MLRWSLLLSTLAFVLAVMAGCGSVGASLPTGASSTGPSGLAEQRITVATSTAVLADLVRNIAGDYANVQAIVPPDRSPAIYEVDPRDGVALSKAAVFFANGYGYEPPALGQLVLNTPKLKVVLLSEGLNVREEVIDHGDHEHRFPNAYFYLNVQYATRYVDRIRATLVDADPAHAGQYEANAKAYTAQLNELDTWIAGEVNRIPSARRRMLTDQATFLYFAERYGLQAYAASYEGTAEAAPSPSQYAYLIGQVKTWGVPAAFSEVGLNPKLLQQLSRDTGVKFVPGLRTSTLDASTGSGTYLDLMKRNTQVIVGALS